MRQENQIGVCNPLLSGGHIGFCSSHGSVTIFLPPGVVMTNVECPYQVNDRRPDCAAMTRFYRGILRAPKPRPGFAPAGYN